MADLWGRKWDINIINEKTGDAWNVNQLRCTFRIEKVYLDLSNISIVEIYNLNAETDNIFVKEGSRITISAGYDGLISANDPNNPDLQTDAQYGQIYDGDIVQAVHSHEDNINYKMSIVCLDSQFFNEQGWIATAILPKSYPRQVINTISSSANFPIDQGNISDNLDKSVLPRGKILFGQPRDYLRDIAYNSNGRFYVEDKKLYVECPNDVPKDEVLKMDAKTGLIGWPQMTDTGITFKCLLNPKIKSQTVVQFDNETIPPILATQRGQLFTPLDPYGQYKVIKYTHIGDTRGNEWYTSCVAVNLMGWGKASMLAMNQINPMGGGR